MAVLMLVVFALLVRNARTLRESEPEKMLLAGAWCEHFGGHGLHLLLLEMTLLRRRSRREGWLADLPQLVGFGLDLYLEHVQHSRAHARLVFFHNKNYADGPSRPI